MISLSEFVTKYTGQSVSFTNCSDNQCMTLMHVYLAEVFGLTDPSLLANPSAFEVYTNFAHESGNQYFDLVANSPTNVPNPGDLVIFGQNIGGTGVNGHICVFVSGDINQFTSFDCNWPTGSFPHLQTHTYEGVLGWLTPKPQGKFLTTDEVTKLTQEAQALEQFISMGYTTPNDVTAKITAYEKQIADLSKQLEDANKKNDGLLLEIKQTQDLVSQAANTVQQQASLPTEAADQAIILKAANQSLTHDIGLVVDELNNAPDQLDTKVIYPPVVNVTTAIQHMQNQYKAAMIQLTKQAEMNKAVQASVNNVVSNSKGFFSSVKVLLQNLGILEK